MIWFNFSSSSFQQPRRGCFEIREDGGEKFISLVVNVAPIFSFTIYCACWVIYFVLWKRFWTVVENPCGKHLSSLFSGFCFAGHEATICANEGSGHGKSHIWYCWWDQMMTDHLQVSHFVVVHEVNHADFFFSFFGRKLAIISVQWSFALTSFAIWFVSIAILLE